MTVLAPQKTRTDTPEFIPSSAVPQKAFKRWDFPIFVALTLLNFAALANLGWHWFAPQNWQSEPLTFLAVTLLLAAVLGIQQSRWFLLPLMRKPPPVPIHRRWKVGVATTFVPGSEPLDMLEETVAALVALDYPHETWVLDEGDDDRVKAICLRHGAKHFSRRHLPGYQTTGGMFASRSKHGNYNAWLSEIASDRYDIVAAFDPDHVPVPAFLKSVLGYFEDSRVGYVQVAQAYRNQAQSWIAQGAAEETYDYFSTIQMASYGLGYPVIVGSHNVHRMAALWDIGGLGAHDADDYLTTLLYRDAGWHGVYVPQILARGLSPVHWDAYLIQQRRWARSVLDIKLRSYHGLSRQAPILMRLLSYCHGLNYLFKGLLPVLALGLLGVMCASGQAPLVFSRQLVVPGIFTLAALGLGELYRQRFFLAPAQEGGLHWRAAILRWAKWPQMVMALWDVLLNRRPPYSITDKSKFGSRRSGWVWPHLLACGVLIVCWLGGGGGRQASSTFLDTAVIVVTLATGALCLADRRAGHEPKPVEAPASP